MFSVRSLLAWSFLVAVASPLPTFPSNIYERSESSLSLSTPLPPSQDPFYTAPANYESAAPGTILRLRDAPGNLTSVVANSSAAYNILYRTTNSLYKPSWAVTTLFVPSSLLSSPGLSICLGTALLSYQIPYNSPDVDASPSYALYSRPPTDIALALGRGWYVSVPDFEGPLASFPAGVEEGHATLDSVRAVLSSGFGLAPDARYAMWGYSGGSIASEWAAELQVQYAPELNFSGVAIGGLVTNLTSALDAVTGTMWAGLAPTGLLGLTSQYPAAYDFLLSKLKLSGPYNRTGFLAAKNMSIAQAFATYANQNIFDYFEGGMTVIEAPILQKIFDNDGLMGYHGVPQMPLFVYKAVADEIALTNETDALVAKYCAVGANILYQRNTIGGHLAEYTNGDAGAFEWLSSVLDGSYSTRYSAQGCTIQNVAINVTSSPL